MVNAQNHNTFEAKLNELKMELAPDKRTVLFKYDIIFEGEKKGKLTGETTSPRILQAVKSLASEAGIDVSGFKILPDSDELIKSPFGVISVSVANIRTKPEHAAEMATQSLMGTIVRVFKKENEWYYIQTPDEYLGWVDPEAITLMTNDMLTAYKSTPKIIIQPTFSMVYTDTEQKAIISDITAGAILTLLKAEFSGALVKLPDGREGFVNKSDYRIYSDWLASAIAGETNIMSTAKRFIGFPYLWGGTSTKGMDCSGFTKTVYFLNGTILPRDASQQVWAGIPVQGSENLEGLLPGDLLFFGEKALGEKKERVTHVGIYLGNKEFIHSSGKIKVNSLDPAAGNYSSYRHKQYLRARRFINSSWGVEGSEIKKNVFYQFH